MFDKLLFVVCLVAGAHQAHSATVSFITKCKSDDANCVKQSTQDAIIPFSKGIPELGIQSLEPLHYKNLDASTSNLKFILNDITVTGLQGCVAKRMQRDVANNKLFVKLLCTVKLDGQYEIDGRILVLPIQGKGDLHAVLKKLLVDVEADIVDKIGKDGKTHWDIKSWKHSYQLKDKSELDLENLFNGNEVLGRAARELLKTSSNEVINEIGPPVVKALLTKIVKTVDVFFKKVPADELSID